jgi:hypothetical protein
MRFLRIFVWLALCGCAYLTSALAQTVPFAEVRRTTDFLYDPFDPPIDRSIVDDNALNKIRLRFGVPDRETSEIVIDHTDPTDPVEILVWYYDGLTIHLQGTADEETRWINQIELVGGDFPLKYGLGLNVDRNEFVTVLEPSLLNNNERRIRFDSSYVETGVVEGYEVRFGTLCVLVVEFDVEGKATKLTWNYYGH